MTTRVLKLSISLPKRLIAIADEVASEEKISRSKVVSRCLEELAHSRREKLMIEYYKTMAKEHRDFTHKSARVIQDIVSSWHD